MITLDSASGYIQFPKILDYQLLMDNIKSILQIDDELFNYLYFSYIDEKDQERVRLNPQIFDDFISQESPTLSIGFLDNTDENIIDQFKDIIDINKKRFKKMDYKIDEDDPSIIHKNNINNDNLSKEKEENEIKLRKDSDSGEIIILEQKEILIPEDSDSKKENQIEIIKNEEGNIENKENINNNNLNIINKQISGNFKLLDSGNINRINSLIDDSNTSNKLKKEESLNLENIDSSEINLIKFDKKLNNNISEEDDKEIENEEEDDFNKNIENIIESNLENIKEDIIHSILVEGSKIQKSKNNKEKPSNNYIHKNYECNICNAFPIKGIRYHCLECIDFDICEKCESKINHEHPLFKIKNDKSCKFKNENYN